MKKLVLVALALAILVVTGCASVSTARTNAFKGLSCEDKSPTVALYATRTGLYFITFPLWTENGRDVDVHETLSDLATEARGQGYTTLNTVVCAEAPYSFPWIFWIKTAHVSATATK